MINQPTYCSLMQKQQSTSKSTKPHTAVTDDENKTENINKNVSSSSKIKLQKVQASSSSIKTFAPLSERMRPNELHEYIGQMQIIGPGTILNKLLSNGHIPSMILWGPPGCGKTSLINVIRKESNKFTEFPAKFIKLSATNAGISDVRKAVTEAETQSKQGIRTIVFMDEIHRFNKLQQDIFLPHVEAGTFTLIGATTENPSFSLNSALLSRCRVFVLNKLNKDELVTILSKAIKSLNGKIIVENQETANENISIKFLIYQDHLEWLSDVCEGDARKALNALEKAIQVTVSEDDENDLPKILSLKDIESALALKAESLSEKKFDNLYHMYSAMHHSIIGSDDNAALYWLVRIMTLGEDPVYIAKRLVQIASENIGVADHDALSLAIHTMHACQLIGMPECDVILTQCVVYLARAEKSVEVSNALKKCINTIENHKGPQPSVPLFIKDVSGKQKLRAALGSKYKNLIHQENVNKCYLPEGLETTKFYEVEDE